MHPFNAILLSVLVLCDDPGDSDLPAREESSGRIEWTSSRVVGSPEPPRPFTTRRAFPSLKHDEAMSLTRGPLGKRLYLLDYKGRVVSFVEKENSTVEVHEFLDTGMQTLGIAFHPGFQDNGFVFAFVISDYFTREESPVDPEGLRMWRSGSTRISSILRYGTDGKDPPGFRPETRTVILERETNGHNGGGMEFGPDGYLYIGTGDGSTDSDAWATGQDVSDLAGGVLRIDVDRTQEDRAYSIPSDNPFIHHEDARPEIWAYGLRQPWRMSFDRVTGELYVGDVGQDFWENVFLVERGGNYGWSVMEGAEDFHPFRVRGPTPILPPLSTHHHTEARSIIGGHVYRGKRFPELFGVYIYGDYVTSKVWGLRHENKKISWREELARTDVKAVGYTEGFDGRFYLVDHNGEIHELVRNSPEKVHVPFPRLLSETGIFTSVADHSPAPGVFEYSVNVPRWMDGARADRLLGVPGNEKVGLGDVPEFPDGSVLVKTVLLDLLIDGKLTPRRIETQIMTRQSGQWAGYSYLWNEDQTDAELSPASGRTRVFDVADASAPGGVRRHRWRTQTRTECMVCHSRATGFAVGTKLVQLDRNGQLERFAAAGLFEKSEQLSEVRGFVELGDSSASLEDRARGYLHTNCAHCHTNSGGGNSEIQLHHSVDREKMMLIGVRPMHADFGIPGAMLVAPGDPDRSVLVQRISRRGHGQMPPLGTFRVHKEAVEVIRAWIASMELTEKESADLDDKVARAQGETGALARWYVTDANSLASRSALSTNFVARRGVGRWPVTAGWRAVVGSGVESFIRLAPEPDGRLRLARTQFYVDEKVALRFRGSSRGSIRVWINGREVYEGDRPRFDVPIAQGLNTVLVESSAEGFTLGYRRQSEDPRHERLWEVVLESSGDPERGRALFFDKAQCSRCHRVGESGGRIGPPLDGLGDRYSMRSLVESILNPSSTVPPRYASSLVLFKDGSTLAGVRVEESNENLTFGTTDGELRVVPKSEIQSRIVQPKVSPMPKGLESELGDQEFLDLITFLKSLRHTGAGKR